MRIFTYNRNSCLVDWLHSLTTATRQYWAKLTEQEKFINEIRGKEIFVISGTGAQHFHKATDTHLKNAAKFIDVHSIRRFATTYLGLTTQQLTGA